MEEQAVQIPDMGKHIDQGTLLRWHKREGEPVREGEPLAEVGLDKVSLELPSPCSGILRRVLVPTETVVSVGATIALIEPVDEALLPPLPTPDYKRFSWRWAVFSLDKGFAIIGGLLLVLGFVFLLKDQPGQVFEIPGFIFIGCYWSLHPFMERLRKRHIQPQPPEEPLTTLEGISQVLLAEGVAGFCLSAAIMAAISPTSSYRGIPGPEIVLGIAIVSFGMCLLALLIKEIAKARRLHSS